MGDNPGRTAFEQVGEDKLRAVIADFVQRMIDDTMIGYFFQNVDRQRLLRHEYQFTAKALGAPIGYEGRPIAQVHAAHRIMGGQFARRLTLLGETLSDHGVPDAVRALLLAHTERLRPLITQQQASHCNDGGSAGPLVTRWRPQTGDDGETSGDKPVG